MRDNYNKYIEGISYSNEPSMDIKLNCNVRQYPNMLVSYQKIADLFDVKTSEIIIGNGFENVMKNVLLAIKPKSIHYSKPSWGFLDVYSQQMSMIQFIHHFIEKNNCGVEQNFEEDIDVYYSTYPFNNCIKTDINYNNVKKSRYSIIDISYLPFDQTKEFIHNHRSENVIIIGSFDKQFGCGLRFGFAIFDKHLSESINLQREHFINSTAYQFLCDEKYNMRYYNNFYDLLLNTDYKWINHNFVVYEGNYDSTCQCRKFDFDGKIYTRFGIPIDEKQYSAVIESVNIIK